KLTVLVALGTHAGMSEPALAAHTGGPYPGATVLNHAWWDASAFADVGAISSERIAELSNGMLEHTAHVRINRNVVEHDVTLIISPVFPHEVVGFSGGNKYLFPGVSGRELLNFFHWLGAVITTPRIIGNKWTPVRKIVDRAGAMLKLDKLCMSLIVMPDESLGGLFIGSP